MAVRTFAKTWILLLAALMFSITSAGGGDAQAKSKKKHSSSARKSEKSSKKSAHKRSKRSKHSKMSGHGVAKTELHREELAKPSGDVWVWAENLGDEVKANIYKEDGSFDDAVLASLDEAFRCKRTQEVRAMNSHLYEQLSRIQDHFGKKRIDIVSGFRFAERSSSRHYHASAMDIRVEGVSTREIYAYAQTLDRGGMGIGIYPNGQFIHVDFRAPGEPSYRWTDYSGGSAPPPKHKSNTNRRTKPARKPVS
jgi:uncharacterized protein YcbK (DUF882 family)